MRRIRVHRRGAKRLIRAARPPDVLKRVLTLKSLAPAALFAFGVNAAALGVEDIVISVVFCELQKKNAKNSCNSRKTTADDGILEVCDKHWRISCDVGAIYIATTYNETV